MLNDSLFSSGSGEWETPQEFFDILAAEFRFSLDAAASPLNTKVPSRYYTKEDNALTRPWRGVVWCNPPYGREIGAFIRKGYEEAQNGATVVMLIPARTDTAWWHGFVMEAAEIRFVRGRLKFVGAENSAPFPSAIIVFRPEHQGPPVISSTERRKSPC